MTKQYWDKWQYRLWLSNKRVSDLDEAARGIWIDWLSTMMEDETYFLTGNLEDFATWGRTTKPKALKALKEVSRTGAADFEIEGIEETCHASVTHFVTQMSRDFMLNVTVVSRKRKRELKKRIDNRLRQQKRRASRSSHADVTRQSKSKSNSNSKELQKKHRQSPSAQTLSDHQQLMKHHADRIGVIGDGGAQGKSVKFLLKHYSPEDCIAYYDYQSKQLISKGGWRDAVSWLTVQKTIGEWIVAGRPAEPLEKSNGRNGTRPPTEKLPTPEEKLAEAMENNKAMRRPPVAETK